MFFCPTARLIYEGAWEDGYVEPLRRLYDNELVYVSAGRFQFDLAGQRQVLSKGAIVIIPPGVWHESRALPGGQAMRHCVHFDWIPLTFPKSRPLASYIGDSFEAEWISPVPKEIRGTLPLLTRIGRRPELREMMETMFRYFSRRQVLGETLLWPVLRLLLMGKISVPPSPSRFGKSARLVLALREYMDRHYAEPQDYATYCKNFQVTASHLCRSFAALMGFPPLVYLTDVRLNHARRLFLETELNVNEVGRAVGIPDSNYFTRLFKRKFGQNPTEFLAQHYTLLRRTRAAPLT